MWSSIPKYKKEDPNLNSLMDMAIDCRNIQK